MKIRTFHCNNFNPDNVWDLSHLDESLDVEVAFEVVVAGRGLVQVPLDDELDGVQSGGADLEQAVEPQLSRDSGMVLEKKFIKI